MRTILVDAFLVATVVSETICVLGVFAGDTVYDRLHFSGATTAVAPTCALVAVALRQPHPYTTPVWNALFVAVALFLLNNVFSQAIARVARQREVGGLEL